MPGRVLILIVLAAAAAAFGAVWLTGGFDALTVWAAERQRAAQNAMAGALRALRAGEPGALIGLLSLAFAYGVVHAAGPGHGKILIGGYGLARNAGALRLGLVAILSSLAQATTAVVLVYAGVLLLGWTRQRLVGAAEDWLAPASYAAIAAIGLWLLLRGARRLAGAGASHHHGGAHEHGAQCTHRHLPSAAEVEALSGWRDAALLIAGIAIRPCTGAVFLLVLTWGMGIPLAGILGAYAMGLGTAAVTLGVAFASASFRGGLALSLNGGTAMRFVLPLVEITAGAVVALAAMQFLMRAL